MACALNFAASKNIMGDKAWYKDWFNSHYYHLLYQHRDEEEALQFIHTLIGYLKPEPGSTMLDVACGKGRHSKALADMGFDVTGIDLSLAPIYLLDKRPPLRRCSVRVAFHQPSTCKTHRKEVLSANGHPACILPWIGEGRGAGGVKK